MTDIQSRLFALRDEAYRDFNAKLIPNIDSSRVIGVRTPRLRALAKQLHGTKEAESFMRALPHEYFEEDQLHAFLIGYEADFAACLEAVERFLPYVDNWATCDQLRPRALGRDKAALVCKIKEWLQSGECYTVRFALDMLMVWFLDEDFSPEYLELAASVESGEYYVRMMLAWYFATALAKRYDCALPYIRERRLDAWTHNKTIQKAAESFRVSDEHKAELRRLRIKRGK